VKHHWCRLAGVLPPTIPRFQSSGGSPAGRRVAPDRHRRANVILVLGGRGSLTTMGESCPQLPG